MITRTNLAPLIKNGVFIGTTVALNLMAPAEINEFVGAAFKAGFDDQELGIDTIHGFFFSVTTSAFQEGNGKAAFWVTMNVFNGARQVFWEAFLESLKRLWRHLRAIKEPIAVVDLPQTNLKLILSNARKGLRWAKTYATESLTKASVYTAMVFKEDSIVSAIAASDAFLKSSDTIKYPIARDFGRTFASHYTKNPQTGVIALERLSEMSHALLHE